VNMCVHIIGNKLVLTPVWRAFQLQFHYLSAWNRHVPTCIPGNGRTGNKSIYARDHRVHFLLDKAPFSSLTHVKCFTETFKTETWLNVHFLP
jgi:hypothetical protein